MHTVHMTKLMLCREKNCPANLLKKLFLFGNVLFYATDA